MDGVLIVPSQSDHLEVDMVEEYLATLGNFGIFPGMPTAEHERSVWWLKPTGTGDADATTAANAATGAYNNIATYGTVNKDDVFFYLGTGAIYDFNGGTTGLLVDVGGVSIFGLGGLGTQCVNSNGSAISVIYMSVSNATVAGFYIAEATASCEGILVESAGVASIYGCYIHDNNFVGAMENAIHINHPGTGSIKYCTVSDNTIWDCTNDGIELSGSDVMYNTIAGNRIYNVGDNAINLNGDDVDGNWVIDNRVNGGAGITTYGITVTLGDNNKISGNEMGELGTAPILDSGSNNSWPKNQADEYTGNFNRTVANGVSEIVTDVQNLDLWTSGRFVIELDINALDAANEGGLIQAWAFTKTDGTNYRKGKGEAFLEGVDVQDRMEIEFSTKGGDSVFQLGFQTSIAVTANRIVYWRITQVG